MLSFAERCESPRKESSSLVSFGRRQDPVLDLLRRTWSETFERQLRILRESVRRASALRALSRRAPHLGHGAGLLTACAFGTIDQIATLVTSAIYGDAA